MLSVAPTAFFSGSFQLSGEHIAVVNGLAFYGIQWIQYLVAVTLAWRQFPQLLIFPILQYALSSGLGFGFPSEILLAPGFLWICLFALKFNSRAADVNEHPVNEHPAGDIQFVSGEKAQALLGPDGSRSNERMGFSWTWPYRSIVVANDFRPSRVIVDPEEAPRCHAPALQASSASRIPAEVTDAVSHYTFSLPILPDRRYLRNWPSNYRK